jgi:hypothetical protein
MPITTSLVRLTLNCAKHGNNFHEVRKDAEGKVVKCNACEFLVHYNQKISTFQREVESLNSALEGFIRTNEVVAVSVGGGFVKGSL